MTYSVDKEMESKIIERLNEVLWSEKDMVYLTRFAGSSIPRNAGHHEQVDPTHIGPEKMIKITGGYVDRDNLKAFVETDFNKLKLDELTKEQLLEILREILITMFKPSIMNPPTEKDIIILESFMNNKEAGGSLSYGAASTIESISKWIPKIAYIVHSAAKAISASKDIYDKFKHNTGATQRRKLEAETTRAEQRVEDDTRDLMLLAEDLKRREATLARRENLEKNIPKDVEELFKRIAKR
jgi:hypothetical protein